MKMYEFEEDKKWIMNPVKTWGVPMSPLRVLTSYDLTFPITSPFLYPQFQLTRTQI